MRQTPVGLGPWQSVPGIETMTSVFCRDKNSTDIFQLYLRPDLFRKVQICLYMSLEFNI